MNSVKTKSHEPLIRVVKKPELPTSKAVVLRIASFVLAIAVGGLFILAIGHNPFEVYKEMVMGCFRSKIALQGTVKIIVPLLITSLGVTLAYKMKFWNIGAEGQMLMGGIFASYFALFQSDMPHWALLIVSFLAGCIGGAIWGIIPAFFKVKFGTNETLFTLMLNYIALYIIDFLRHETWRDPGARGFPKIASFAPNARIGAVFDLQGGWVIALIMVVAVFVLLKYTKFGYEISVVGESQPTARYAGMSVKKVVILTMALSGAICGSAGMIKAMGSDYTLTLGLADGVGFTAIIVAWLGQLNPFIILLITIFFSIIEKGSGVIQSTFNISVFTSDVLQGIILFFIIASEFFTRYSFAFKKGGKSR